MTFFADRYQEDLLRQDGLNGRQIKAVLYTKAHNRITNSDYQHLNDCSRNTASSDLKELIQLGWIQQQGKKRSGFFLHAEINNELHTHCTFIQDRVLL